jgi:glutamine amidotransferase
MCRILGFAAATPASVRSLIGDEQLAQFTALSQLHADGWGSAWLTAPGAPNMHTQRAATGAAGDPQYRACVERDTASARILHLRWATDGYRIAATNTHPFTSSGIAFAHNGSVSPDDALRSHLDEVSLGELRGDTDSEQYFALIRQELRTQPGDLAAAATRAVAALRRSYVHTSFNAMLLTADELVVVHANSIHDTPVDDLLAAAGGAPHDHLNAYYLMRWTQIQDGSLLFASSGLAAQGWEPLPEESVTTVNLHTLEMRQLSVANTEMAVRSNVTE